MSDQKLESFQGLKTALVHVVPQLNAHDYGGWIQSCAVGTWPSTPTSWCHDSRLNESSAFEDVLMKRRAAQNAISAADTDRKLRRALLRRYMGTTIPLLWGTCCYWRDARLPDLAKIRWHGPVEVVLREVDQDYMPLVYWIAHKTQLLRCAPHHGRPDFHVSSTTAIDDVKEASRLLHGLKSRGVLRFLDLGRVNKRHINEVEEDEEEFQDHDAEREDHRKRRRLAERCLDIDQYDDYEPSEPAEPRMPASLPIPILHDEEPAGEPEIPEASPRPPQTSPMNAEPTPSENEPAEAV